MKKIYTPVKKKTILIVDDDQVVVHIYREKFQREGFKVEVADNGESTMERLKKDPVDLVILDLCLPGMDGVEVLKNIRSEFEMQALPVIVFSNAYLGNLVRRLGSRRDQMYDESREHAGPDAGARAGPARC